MPKQNDWIMRNVRFICILLYVLALVLTMVVWAPSGFLLLCCQGKGEQQEEGLLFCVVSPPRIGSHKTWWSDWKHVTWHNILLFTIIINHMDCLNFIDFCEIAKMSRSIWLEHPWIGGLPLQLADKEKLRVPFFLFLLNFVPSGGPTAPLLLPWRDPYRKSPTNVPVQCSFLEPHLEKITTLYCSWLAVWYLRVHGPNGWARSLSWVLGNLPYLLPFCLLCTKERAASFLWCPNHWLS